MQIFTTTKGYSLVEVLVAVAILMIAIVGPLTIAAKSIQSTQYARQQVTAFFLAQEGINAIQVIRNSEALSAYGGGGNLAWDWVNDVSYDACFDADGCNIDFRDASLESNVQDCTTLTNCTLRIDNGGAPTAADRQPLYEYNPSGINPIYTRVITLDSVSANEVMINVTVSWESNLFGATQSVTLETSVLDVYKF